MKYSVKTTFLLIIALVLTLTGISYANNLTKQPEVQKFIQRVSKRYGYSQSYVRNILNNAHFNSDVITKMEHPYEAKPWYEYQKLFVTENRVNEGIEYWSRSNKLVSWEEKEYQVPGNIILAIIGVESKYGRQMGHFNVLDTLSTLAFRYPERARFFQYQLGAYIALCKTFKVSPYTTRGSYAGAMGQCQFMPSSYLHYGVDFHGKGSPNLFNDKADVIFSVGNYLRQNGWELDEPVATPASLTGTQYRKILKHDSRRPQKPTLSLAQLARLGVKPSHGFYNSHLKANLIKLQGKNGPQYWLAFHNFYVITTYNASDLYAMAVYQLSLKLKNAWNAKQNS